MPARTIYIQDDIEKYIDEKKIEENRKSFSNALDTIIREAMEKEKENAENE